LKTFCFVFIYKNISPNALIIAQIMKSNQPIQSTKLGFEESADEAEKKADL
jgi:hypothetical protein